MSTPASDNSDQIEFWNGPGGKQWVINQERMDENLKPFLGELVALAAPVEGEHVLDIGCGCGATTLAFAKEVGAAGKAIGLDISEPMIARAQERAAEAAGNNKPAPDFLVNDASIHDFSSESYDAVVSRFGVMFFATPEPAFKNIRSALRPDGRLAFICWQPVEKNPFFHVPMAAAISVVGAPEPTDPFAPGPFAFGDQERTRAILEGAGFTDVRFEDLALNLPIGDGTGPESAAAEMVRAGPVARISAEADEETQAKILAAVTSVLADHMDGNQVYLGTHTWKVTAKNPG